MRVHPRDLPRMRGAGVGSFFTNIFSDLLPLGEKVVDVTKKALQSDMGKAVVEAAKRKAVETGINVAEEALRGQNVKAAAKEHIKRAGKELVEETVDMGKRKRGGGKRNASTKRGGGKRGALGKVGRRGGGKSRRKGGRAKKKKVRGTSNLLKQWL